MLKHFSQIELKKILQDTKHFCFDPHDCQTCKYTLCSLVCAPCMVLYPAVIILFWTDFEHAC